MRNWKTILGALVIFVLGMLAGGLIVGGRVMRRLHRVQNGQPLFNADEVTRFLKHKLDLDATQQDKVRAVVTDAQVEAGKVRRTTDAQLWSVITNAVEQMRPALRADQQVKLDQLVAERRAHRLE